MTITPTEEQQAIIAEARTPDSLLINALAGAAKTSTLVMLAQGLPIVPTVCLAFNKRIAEEMATRMPSFITCQTMNSVGHRAWGSRLGKRLVVNSDKLYTIVKRISDAMPQKERQEKIGENFATLLRATRLCKSAGYVPEAYLSMADTRWTAPPDLMLEVFGRQLDLDPDDGFLWVLDRVLEQSIVESYNGVIDFDDQIYMSALFGGGFPKYENIMVDEAQDLSPLNHLMLERMYNGRLIAVGDPRQAIYAFRGASHSSMSELQGRFKMRELTLSVSFRCPRRVVENVHWWVPHMRFPDWAAEGTVTRLTTWSSADIPDGAAIICRNNAPLFKTGVRLLKAGRGIKLLGNDIGANLIKILEKLGPDSMTQAQVYEAIEVWRDAELKKVKAARVAAVEDKTECLMVFAEAGRTLAESIAYATMVMAQEGKIQLMTGHKAKGGEWDNVFHLDSWLVPSKWSVRQAEMNGDDSALIQEKNLKYVIDTRAKTSLAYINTEDFNGTA